MSELPRLKELAALLKSPAKDVQRMRVEQILKIRDAEVLATVFAAIEAIKPGSLNEADRSFLRGKAAEVDSSWTSKISIIQE